MQCGFGVPLLDRRPIAREQEHDASIQRFRVALLSGRAEAGRCVGSSLLKVGSANRYALGAVCPQAQVGRSHGRAAARTWQGGWGFIAWRSRQRPCRARASSTRWSSCNGASALLVGLHRVLDGFPNQLLQGGKVDILELVDVEAGSARLEIAQSLHQFRVPLETGHDIEGEVLFTW